MPTFLSKSRGLRLTRRSQEDVPMPNGTFHTTVKPVRYTFWPDGRLDVHEGQDILPDGPPKTNAETGEIVRDEFGRPVQEMQDAVAWLRSHRLYNKPAMIGGFTEDGREPNRIPDAAPRVREIIAAMARLDLATLHAFAAEEAAAPYSRPSVDAALEEALETVAAAQEALAAQQEEDGQSGDATGGSTSENAAGDELDGLGMAALREVGAGLGLAFVPGTSKMKARELIREAQAQVAA